MADILLEAAVDSAGDAERAVREGADRLEVCANLDVGGLTPSIALLRHCLALAVPCVPMARPRAGDFVYDAAERATLEADAAALRDAGAHGVVFGVLTPDRVIDADAVRHVVKIGAGIETVFHRAFDQTPNALESLQTLIACGMTRILTSGLAATAAAGTASLAALIAHAGERIQILPGSGVRAHNVIDIVRRTGATQVHARATERGVISAIRSALAAT